MVSPLLEQKHSGWRRRVANWADRRCWRIVVVVVVAMMLRERAVAVAAVASS